MRSLIRISIIGFGYMGQWHYHHLSQNTSFEIVGIYDIDESALNLGVTLGLVAYKNEFDVFADDIDAVIISTPNDSHEHYIELALNNGKHVICEKPVTMNQNALIRLIDIAHSRNCLFTGHFNRRWDIDYVSICECVKTKSIGRINYIESRVLGERGLMFGWRARAEKGGGLLLDWAPHLVDQALQMNEDLIVESVFSDIRKNNNVSVDDYFRIRLRFSNDLLFYIECGVLSLYRPPRWHVYGSMGTFSAVGWDGQINCAVIKSSISEDAIPNRYTDYNDKSSRLMSPLDKGDVQYNTFQHNSACSQSVFYDNFAEAVFTRCPLLVSEKDMIRVSKIIDAAIESSKREQVIFTSI